MPLHRPPCRPLLTALSRTAQPRIAGVHTTPTILRACTRSEAPVVPRLARSMVHLRQIVRPIAFAVPAVAAYAYYRHRQSKPETFDLAVPKRGPDGKRTFTQMSVPMLSMDEVDARIRQNAIFKTTLRPDGILWKQATAFLPANDPIEDANADTIVEQDLVPNSPPGDFLFYTVMDGHAGPHTSQLLSKTLIPAVGLELANLTKESAQSSSQDGIMQRLRSLIWPTSSSSVSLDADPQAVSGAIKRTFTRLDWELINAPLRILAAHLDKAALEKNIIPDLSQHPMALATMLPAMSGSCALMALFDTARRNLYVACTGDSRAVAGYWEETEDGQGHWRVEVLTEDQTGRNPKELQRIQSEHPPDEADAVIQRGRILGGLEPSRAFGDARYKWPREIQEMLGKAFLEGNNKPMRPAPSALKTPPYVTACPEVTHRKLTLPSSDPKPKSALRFLVLATDGLWDELTSDEVVALVGGHLAGLQGTVPKASLPSLVPTSAGAPTVDGKAKHRGNDAQGTWEFRDENVSAHLIRNAFGGGDHEHLRKTLSIPAPYARNFRDDITVTVVWWEDARSAEPGVKQGEGEAVRTKL
ncbi:protein serine/threonine phosphatase 2C [Obba rivulosa]|uniref:Protein serine/threonine phosphatase 2C n=1 Tax=Obba rivulosa TaxID=1052685 RepID=A0A8E2DUN6_9APHY|nr:protein serine/threonine phosphatase 2C [Obba rivulosa]